jgi:hypothetical protein
MGGILNIIFGLLRMIFGGAGQAEGALKHENKQQKEENEIIAKQRDSNINNVHDANRLFDKARRRRKK